MLSFALGHAKISHAHKQESAGSPDSRHFQIPGERMKMSDLCGILWKLFLSEAIGVNCIENTLALFEMLS